MLPKELEHLKDTQNELDDRKIDIDRVGVRSLRYPMRIRDKAHATGLWPAGKKAQKEGGRDYNLELQENKILVPSAFSPLQ